MIGYKSFRKVIEKRLLWLDKIIREKEAGIKDAPDGELRAAKNGRTVQYFIRYEGGDTNGKYLKKEERGLAKTIAQKEYDNKVLLAAKEEYKILKRLMKVYMNKNIESVPEKIAPLKMALVTPVEKSDEEYVEEWLAQEYEPFDYYSEALTYENSKGIKMRSKSEVLISNILDELGIPYLYEKPLRLPDNRKVGPDFTLLDMRNRQEVYLEHLGMLDNMDYMQKNIRKIGEYEDAGIYRGTRLLITYETKNKQFNVKRIKGMLAEYFGKNI